MGGWYYLKLGHSVNKFSGYLYNGSNAMPPAHDADGRNIAQQIQPLDANGHPYVTGKIGVVGIGMQNWTLELCTPNTPFNGCLPYTFTDDVAKLAGVNPKTVLVDCAQGGNYAADWENPGSSAWKTCLNRMAARTYKVTPAPVQVVLWKEIHAFPKVLAEQIIRRELPSGPGGGCRSRRLCLRSCDGVGGAHGEKPVSERPADVFALSNICWIRDVARKFGALRLLVRLFEQVAHSGANQSVGGRRDRSPGW
jgi:hypothetical protein